MGRETLPNGGKILTDISKNTSPDVQAEDIVSKYFRDVVSKHVTESTQRLNSKLLDWHRKRVRQEMTPGWGGKKFRKTTNRAQVIKGTSYSVTSCLPRREFP